jgi:hypothetical protein
MIVTVNKIIIQDPEFGTLTKPDTTAEHWQLISEDETTMTIEILDEPTV